MGAVFPEVKIGIFGEAMALLSRFWDPLLSFAEVIVSIKGTPLSENGGLLGLLLGNFIVSRLQRRGSLPQYDILRPWLTGLLHFGLN